MRAEYKSSRIFLNLFKNGMVAIKYGGGRLNCVHMTSLKVIDKEDNEIDNKFEIFSS